jgi:hypothetical protein
VPRHAWGLPASPCSSRSRRVARGLGATRRELELAHRRSGPRGSWGGWRRRARQSAFATLWVESRNDLQWRRPSASGNATYSGQKWSDTAYRTLEAQLGKVILGVEDAAEEKAAAKLAAEERATRECEAQRSTFWFVNRRTPTAPFSPVSSRKMLEEELEHSADRSVRELNGHFVRKTSRSAKKTLVRRKVLRMLGVKLRTDVPLSMLRRPPYSPVSLARTPRGQSSRLRLS